MRKIFMILMVLSVVLIIAGCSGGPPDDIIRGMICKQHFGLNNGTSEIVDDFKVTNEYTKDITGETVYYIEYKIVTQCTEKYLQTLDKSTREMMRGPSTSQDTLCFIKQGNAWYTPQ